MSIALSGVRLARIALLAPPFAMGAVSGGAVALLDAAKWQVVVADEPITHWPNGEPMEIHKHDLGDVVTVRATFTDPETDDELDPDVVKLSIRNPAGTVTTYTYGDGAVVVRDSVGKYRADINANLSRKWSYRWWSTGNGQAAEESHFLVNDAQAV